MSDDSANTAYLIGRYAPPVERLASLERFLQDSEALAFLGNPKSAATRGSFSLTELAEAGEVLRQVLFFHSLFEFAAYAGFVAGPPGEAAPFSLLTNPAYVSFALTKLNNPLLKKFRRRLGGHWNENRANPPITREVFYRVLLLIGETHLDEEITALGQLASPRNAENGQRAYLLEILRDPVRLANAFNPAGEFPDTRMSDLILTILRTLERFDEILSFVRTFETSAPDAVEQLGALYALIAGPLNGSLDVFLGEAATCLAQAEDQLRNSPFHKRSTRPFAQDFSSQALRPKTAEELLLQAIFGIPEATTGMKKLRLKSEEQKQAEGEASAEAAT